ncbi:MAG: CbiX/SirB N-terminal domain-containing protein [Cyanobacteria bacterium P01_F01_bin.56]
MRTAYLLVSHGSSDPRHQAGLTRLARGVRQHLGRLSRSAQAAISHHGSVSSTESLAVTLPSALESQNSDPEPVLFRSRSHPQGLASNLPIVGTATLEAAEHSLATQIVQFTQRIAPQDVQQLVIIPLFLLAGVHVKEDLPAEIAAAQQQLSAGLKVKCLPYLGGRQPFKDYVAARLAKTKADRCVLLAHGSRRTAGNRAIQQLGQGLNADVAFWAVAPDLETQVYNLLQQGHQHIAIAPFFLFPGSITDTIIHRTEQIAEHLPKLSLRLLSPLGTSSDLSKVIAEIALTTSHRLSSLPWSKSTPAVAENSITA